MFHAISFQQIHQVNHAFKQDENLPVEYYLRLFVAINTTGNKQVRGELEGEMAGN